MISSRVLAAAAASVLLGAAPALAAPGDVVSLEFDDLATASVAAVTTSTSTGTAGLVSYVVTRDGGQALAAEGPGGTALRLPAYVASTAEPRAVLRLTNATGTDQLSPGTADFSFGAMARLDAESQGTVTDNGNNLVQRGLGGDVAQYKLDLDGRDPGCAVKGSLGRVAVRLREPVSPDDWYGLSCARTGSTLTLTVDRHHADGTTTRTVRSASGLTGAVTMASPAIPLSVGGKLNAKGAVVAATDQFNGVVDGVFLRISS